MSDLRRVVAAHYSGNEEVYFRVAKSFQDTWQRGLEDSIDSTPEQPVSPDYPRLWPSDEEAAEMAQELEDAMDDDLWHSRGEW